MTEISIPDFDPATIAQAIRAATPPSPPVPAHGPQDKVPDDVPFVSLPRLSFQDPRVAKDRYRLEDLLRYHDCEFIANAYRCLLRRPADTLGLNAYLQKLRNGEFSRIDILGRIRFSIEGRKHGIRIEGLLLPLVLQRLGRTPLVGGVFRFMADLAAMPAVSRANEKCHAEASARQNDVGDHLNKLTHAVEMHLAALLEELADKISMAELDKLHQLIDSKAGMNSVATSHRDLQNQLETGLTHSQAALDAVHGELFAIMEKFAEKVDVSRFEDRLVAVNRNFDAVRRETRTVLATKADTTSVRELSRRMATTKGEFESTSRLLQQALTRQEQALIAALVSLDSLRRGLNGKVDQAQLTDLRDDVARRAEQVAELHHRLNEKADSASIAKINGLLMTKADIGQLRQMAAQLGFQDTELAGQLRQLDVLFNEKLAGLASADRPVGEHFDKLFVALADEFRGPRDEVKERMRYYLPFLEQADADNDGSMVLDVGCGRGEFLELLREQGINGLGIDLNPELVRSCNEASLRADCADALEFLRAQPPASLPAVTAFHIIEHLPLPVLLELLQETFRVLREDGVAIFETPNPHNVLVGSCDFYLDPTHRHPLPPQLARFLFEQVGFSEVVIHTLNPSTSHPVEETSDLANRFNRYFYGSMDYGIVARKKGLS